MSHLEPLEVTRPLSPDWRFGFISGCENCGVLFANPLPRKDELAHLYSPDGAWGLPRQSRREVPVSRAQLNRLFAPVASELNVLAPRHGASVLDIGCGLGGMLDTLADAGWLTYGIDPAVRSAFERHRDAVEIPTNAQFDLVILYHVLEHVTDPLAMLRRAAGALHIGGYLIVSVPNIDCADEHGDFNYCLRSKTHVLAYSEVCMRWLTAEAGLALVSARDARESRHLVGIYRRDATLVSLPSVPLAAARDALDRYFARHPAPGTLLRAWPVRLRAATLNLQRSRRVR